MFFIAIAFLIAQSNNTSSQTQSDPKAYNSVSYEISGNGLENSSYLFGTIHIIPKSGFELADIVTNKFKNCRTLVLEANIDISMKEQVKLVKKMLLPDGKQLSDYMTEDQFNEFKTFLLDTLEIKKYVFNKILKIKPIYSGSIILAELLGKTTGYEQEFSTMAKKQKMSHEYIETLDYQLNTLDGISLEEQVEMLLEDEENLSPLDSYNELLEGYKAGDAGKMHELSTSDIEFENFEKKLFIDRNNNCIPKI